MGKLDIVNVLVSICYTNCYLIKNIETGEGVIVDPGDNELKISAAVSKLGMKPVAILLTHGHYDHVGAVKALKKRYNIKSYISREDNQVLRDSRTNLSTMFGEPMTDQADVLLSDGEQITLAGIDMKFILTPGHTPGSGCFYIEEEGVLISGDTLFCASRGRTDFPGGSERDILTSIRQKLLILPDDTDVLPGHNESTTIGSEKYYY